MFVRWRIVREIFESVCDLDAGQRQVRLAEIGSRDADLRAEVERLLASSEQAPALWEVPAVRALIGAEGGDADQHCGGRIGPYRLLRLIAAGGMGAVYLARRDDDASGDVAIKVIMPGLSYSGEARNRFLHERQTLGRLDHPHIAKLLDGGMSRDGLPYLVMEYVEGRPIDSYCALLQLPIPDRLRLFLRVCQAVHYAHQNLIVHRDLKPSNILVTGAGVLKLVDFGIAKMIPPPGTHVVTTAPAQRMMTLEYASPEQICGQPITTASDVYSLGVVLYELLAGRRPDRFGGRPVSDFEGSSDLPEPALPSAVARRIDPALARRLTGDLDAIVAVAMCSEPARRYASVEQMSDDIRRYLSGLPLRVRPNLWRYRAVKFLRRRKAAVAAAGAVALSIIGGVLATAWQSRVALRERDRAVQAQRNSADEARKAEQVSLFLQQMLASVDPRSAGRDVTVHEVLEQASMRVDREMEDYPDLESAIRAVIGRTYHSLGRYWQAEPHLRAVLDRMRRSLGSGHPGVTGALADLGSLLTSRGDYAAAEVLLYESLTRRAALGPDDLNLAATLSQLGKLVQVTGGGAAAEPLWREALAIRRAVLGPQHLDVASSLTNLATAVQARGNLPDAHVLYCEALVVYYRRGDDEHPDYSDVLNNLASLLKSNHQYEKAEVLYRQSLAIRRRCLGPDHPNVARSLSNLAGVVAARGEHRAAVPLLREVLAVRRSLLHAAHPDVATSLNNLAMTLQACADSAGAEPLLREAVTIAAESLPDPHWQTALLQLNHGNCLIQLQRYPEAERQLQASFSGFEAAVGRRDPRTRQAVTALVQLYERWGRLTQAAPWRQLLTQMAASAAATNPQAPGPH